jgi:hypothetical protein
MHNIHYFNYLKTRRTRGEMSWTRSINSSHPKTEISLIVFKYQVGPHEEQTPSVFLQIYW